MFYLPWVLRSSRLQILWPLSIFYVRMTFKENHFLKDCTADPVYRRCMPRAHFCEALTTTGRFVNPARLPLPTKWAKNIVLRVVVYCSLLIAFNRGIFWDFTAFTRFVLGHLTSRSWDGVHYHGAAGVMRLAYAEDEKCGVL